jgi:predicted MFS family arabinose efflux permease
MMISDPRRLAIGLAGFGAFLNLYAPQAVLPLLAQEFEAGAARAGMVITATTLAVALIAPFTGVVADVLGRRRLIVIALFALVLPTIMAALAPSLPALIFWRFVQGLLLPPIFAVTVAYIGDEWRAAEATGVVGLYMSAGGFGGFFGRFATGVIADFLDWRSAFFSLAALTFALAVGVAAWLPAERHFSRSEDLLASGRRMLRHLARPQLVATFAIGFGVLFTFVATFTYVNFYLAAPPFGLSPAMLGSIFVVYLLGTVATPMTGRAVARFGRRPLVIGLIGLWICGVALTLVPALPAIIIGLALTAGCGFVCQAVSTSFVAVTAGEGRSSAVGLYVTSYYVGGSIGGALPGLAWNAAGWPGCVAMVVTVLLLMAGLVGLFWKGPTA